MKTDIVVLAVDDDMINIKLLKSMLLKDDKISEVVEASNGADAISMLKSRTDIDIVLLDIIMPVMNGMEALEVIREDEKFHNTPVIMLTTDETKKAEAIELGANDFITKPVPRDELLKKLHTLVNL